MNIWDATQERLALVFSECDNVCVSFSGGKDSGLLLHLCADFVRREKPQSRLSVFHMDYEAQYQQTTDFVATALAAVADVATVYHCCLPMAAQCATSMHQTHWIPWDRDLESVWVRGLPTSVGVVHEENCPFDFFVEGMWDYELQERFGPWLHQHTDSRRTACLVGIRTQESLNRWRAIHADRNYRAYRGLQWTRQVEGDVWNAYPVFDWTTEDVWAAHAKQGWTYNAIYDLFHQAGVPLGKMRVASPFNDYAKESLSLYRAIDPRNWGRMLGRVDGVNFTSIYGGTTAMGWKGIVLPPGHTWQSYCRFLLATLPPKIRENYERKLEFSIKFWRETGGCLLPETVAALRAQGVAVDDSGTTKRSTKRPVRMEYLDDTDLDEFQYIPTWKRMCVCILKNDHMCKYMGFAPNKTDVERRHAAERLYRDTWSPPPREDASDGD